MNRTSGGDLAKEHPCGEIENMGYVSIDQPLDLKLSLTMGQAFRWQSKNDGWYSGVLRGKLFHVKETAGGVDYRVGGSDGVEVANTQWDGPLRSYFRLDTDDIENIYADLRGRQDALIPALERYRGMRVLRQEPWECLVSYLCSAPASVERISQDMETLAGEYGERVTLDGDARYTFPGPEVLAGANESSLRRLGLGFKAPRIIAAARLVSRNEGELDRLRAVPYQDAKNRLMEYPGIGPKVADCICLMALDKLEAFPIDRHIRRAAIDIAGSKMTDAAMVRWAQQHFGPYAGYVGQYLFHEQRQQASGRPAGSAPKRRSGVHLGEAVAVTNKSRYRNRNWPCPKCGVGLGQVCRYPSNYHYVKGHSQRGPRE